jgi:hypothetical protein
MGLSSFERGLERMVDGVFGRAFRSNLKPVELGRRLLREMDDHRNVDVKGRTVVPNAFTFRISRADNEQLVDVHEALVSELCDAAREYARDEGYWFLGPVKVAVEVNDQLRPGRFELVSQMQQAAGGAGAGSLVLNDGTRIPLASKPVVIGRHPDSDIVLNDANVSRRHAEVRAAGQGFAISDLQSTNGTRVNGLVVGLDHPLANGDVITIGSARIRFEAS